MGHQAETPSEGSEGTQEGRTLPRHRAILAVSEMLSPWLRGPLGRMFCRGPSSHDPRTFSHALPSLLLPTFRACKHIHTVTVLTAHRRRLGRGRAPEKRQAPDSRREGLYSQGRVIQPWGHQRPETLFLPSSCSQARVGGSSGRNELEDEEESLVSSKGNFFKLWGFFRELTNWI